MTKSVNVKQSFNNLEVLNRINELEAWIYGVGVEGEILYKRPDSIKLPSKFTSLDQELDYLLRIFNRGSFIK